MIMQLVATAFVVGFAGIVAFGHVLLVQALFTSDRHAA